MKLQINPWILIKLYVDLSIDKQNLTLDRVINSVNPEEKRSTQTE